MNNNCFVLTYFSLFTFRYSLLIFHLFNYFCASIFASLAQLVEQLTRNEQVGGSNPLRGSDISQ
jgi:hypothetical protein